MTNHMTGIDIRKTLLKHGLVPSQYDEQAIFNANPETEDAVLTLASENPYDLYNDDEEPDTED